MATKIRKETDNMKEITLTIDESWFYALEAEYYTKKFPSDYEDFNSYLTAFFTPTLKSNFST